jgi:hypothetical protein
MKKTLLKIYELKRNSKKFRKFVMLIYWPYDFILADFVNYLQKKGGNDVAM